MLLSPPPPPPLLFPPPPPPPLPQHHATIDLTHISDEPIIPSSLGKIITKKIVLNQPVPRKNNPNYLLKNLLQLSMEFENRQNINNLTFTQYLTGTTSSQTVPRHNLLNRPYYILKPYTPKNKVNSTITTSSLSLSDRIKSLSSIVENSIVSDLPDDILKLLDILENNLQTKLSHTTANESKQVISLGGTVKEKTHVAPTVVTTDNKKEKSPIDYNNDDNTGTTIIDDSFENDRAGNLSVPDPLDNGMVVTTMNNNNHRCTTSQYSKQYYSERSSYNHGVSYDRFNNIQVATPASPK